MPKSRYGKKRFTQKKKQDVANVPPKSQATEVAVKKPAPVVVSHTPKVASQPKAQPVNRYPHITRELIRIGILAGIMAIILIVLAIVLT